MSNRGTSKWYNNIYEHERIEIPRTILNEKKIFKECSIIQLKLLIDAHFIQLYNLSIIIYPLFHSLSFCFNQLMLDFLHSLIFSFFRVGYDNLLNKEKV